ncbi:MAG: hypothetical protein KAT68_08555 [Bacteroidales bacterium]|nr:hypothetical protein [Bacteroidales bacterium]
MKKILIFFLTSIIIYSSCKDKVTTTCYSIINNSDHKIALKMFNAGNIIDSLFLIKNDFKDYHYSYRGKGEPMPFFFGDSIDVVYDDTIAIIHTRLNLQLPSKNLLLMEDFSGGEIGDYEYKYEFIFTETDYNEALEHQ